MSVQLDQHVKWATELGFHVFAVDSPESETCSGVPTAGHDPETCTDRGKHPAGKWSTLSSNRLADVADQFIATGPRNYGIDLGKSGHLVVDEDEPDGFARFCADRGIEMPGTFTVETHEGRRHYYFTDTTGRGNRAGPLKAYGCDVRGRGGYVVGPGSLHASGSRYRVINAVGPVPLPTKIAEALAPASRPEAPEAPVDETVTPEELEAGDRYVASVLDGVVARLQEMQKLAKPDPRDYEGPPWDQSVYAECCTVLELANSPWNTFTAEAVMNLILDHAPRDRGFGEEQITEKWRSAVKTVGTKGRPKPKFHSGTSIFDDPGLQQPSPQGAPSLPAPAAPVAPVTIDHCRGVFTQWLGTEYDLLALDATLCAAAVEQLDGDPVWLLLVSGSGNAKTETVQALAGAGATITSTITSEGALLSATSRKEQSRDATGGLLRKIGDRGLLVLKDFTSILSMNRDIRASVLAALREVYDGKWERNVGTDGGRTLTWNGRVVLVGAVTTAYDSAHSVIAAMGDRFALIRMDSTKGRMASGRMALSNVGHEEQMRRELSQAAGGVLAGVRAELAVLTDADYGRLLAAANLVTTVRTAVERDYRGQVIDAHLPEMPTRFAKMLGQMVRGGLALGMSRDRAHQVAMRVARDSVPPLRLTVLVDVYQYPGARLSDVVRRLQKPRSTLDRVLQELHVLDLLVVDAEPTTGGGGGGWRYSVAPHVDLDALRALRQE